MKLFLALLGAILSLGILVAVIWGFRSGNSPKVAGYSINDPNAPKVEIQEKRYDFGKISLSDVVKHDFKIKNTGKNPLIITDLMTSCHCTTVVLKVAEKSDSPTFGMHSEDSWQGEIPPETEGVLEVTYEPAKHPARGSVSRVITFTSNDPGNPTVQLEIVAQVE